MGEGEQRSVRLAVGSRTTQVSRRVAAIDQDELGSMGGHGRTGTALACLAVLAGCPPAGAVAWVRANYCQSTVETAEQEALVLTLNA
jgi:hypothetical protein